KICSSSYAGMPCLTRRRLIFDRTSLSISFISGPTRSGSDALMRWHENRTTETPSHRDGRFDGRIEQQRLRALGELCVAIFLCASVSLWSLLGEHEQHVPRNTAPQRVAGVGDDQSVGDRRAGRV